MTQAKIQNADIAHGAVSYANIQNESATTLLGNPTGSGAAPGEITLGANLSFSGSVLNASGGGTGLTWSEVTTTTVSLAVNNGYVMNNASRVIGTLPATAAQFSIIRIVGKGAGGWQIAQNSGQTIHFDSNNTTTGTGGSLSSQSTFDCLDLLCITANTDFIVTSSIGNITGV